MTIIGVLGIGLALLLVIGRLRRGRPQADGSSATIIFVHPFRLFLLGCGVSGIGAFMVYRGLFVEHLPAMAASGAVALIPALWIVARAIRFMARGLRVFFYG